MDRELQRVSTGRSLLSRSFSSRPSSGNASSDQSKGPLGLTTLHNPGRNSVKADLVFVHGLGGGSQSTWTKEGDPSLYWPKEWLPNDEDFQDVGIHSFGYDSNWDKESILGIHEFANALLGSILDCPAMPPDTRVRLAFFFCFLSLKCSTVFLP